jgi:hypothetical protein
MNVLKQLFNTKYACGSFLIFFVLAISVSDTFGLSLAITPEALTHKADLIILGRVKTKITEERPYIAGVIISESMREYSVEVILTEYEVELEKSYKQVIGEPEILILTQGGFLPDGRSWTHSKYFELDVGQKFVAFLYWNTRNKTWQVYAGSQGIFKVEEDASNSESPIVTSAYDGHLVYRDASPPHDRERNTKLTLQELLDIIEEETKH